MTKPIRQATASDLPAIAAIVANAYGKYVARIGKPPAPMTDDYAAHIRNGTISVIEHAGAVAGLIVLLPQPDLLLLDNIAVDPAHHGHRLGRALMDFAEQEAARRGYTELRLYTHEKMTENLAMYPALGWQETGRAEQSGFQRVFFRKPVSPTGPTLRRASLADAPAIRDVTRAAYAKWVPVIGREPMPMRADYEAAVRNHLIDLLELGGQAVALIETIPEPDHLLIENIAVHPEHQRRGHGRTLLTHAETLAASLGFAELRLYTNKDFASNVRLYVATGYTVDREEPFMGGITTYMSKRLR